MGGIFGTCFLRISEGGSFDRLPSRGLLPRPSQNRGQVHPGPVPPLLRKLSGPFAPTLRRAASSGTVPTTSMKQAEPGPSEKP